MLRNAKTRWIAALLVPLLAGGSLHAEGPLPSAPLLEIRSLPQAPPFQREDPAPGIIHLRLHGEGRALGIAEGTALKGEIREAYQSIVQLIAAGGPGFPTRAEALALARRLEPFIPEKYREEMRGLAVATGLPYEDILQMNVSDDLLHLQGCSSAVLLGSGPVPMLHGRNLEYGLRRLAQVKVVTDLDTGSVHIRSVGFPGYIGIVSGSSSRGLALTCHTSVSNRIQLGESAAFIYRRMLEEGRSLEDMKSILEKARRATGNSLALSDGRNNVAMALEFDAQEVRERGSEGGRLFVTNHYWDPGLQAHQDRKFLDPGSWSQVRLARMKHFLADEPNADLRLLEITLSHVATLNTVQSIVMEPAHGRIWVAASRDTPVTQGEYLEIPGEW